MTATRQKSEPMDSAAGRYIFTNVLTRSRVTWSLDQPGQHSLCSPWRWQKKYQRMASWTNSTTVVTHGQALNPNPFQPGMPIPSTKTRFPVKFMSMAMAEQITPGRKIFCEVKKELS
eukprot:CAMPEP_0115147492 /NCGR_PEP_ID=MMETSP0227-20121206/63346_1 /TAXON_ID=89957 /ORGANISM="Polarella glacialis, Strain CCMP 1383" /LENGTH=116 /DNA_ID=CAMNT_0002557417 /DNA_START=673 /DNA_END=1023 /DNA_ORIENTATION=+